MAINCKITILIPILILCLKNLLLSININRRQKIQLASSSTYWPDQYNNRPQISLPKLSGLPVRVIKFKGQAQMCMVLGYLINGSYYLLQKYVRKQAEIEERSLIKHEKYQLFPQKSSKQSLTPQYQLPNITHFTDDVKY